ncbi:MAG: cysteine--tRNA ligase [Candidatus Omnitrophota bacterium]|nr:cysteine--tRNA ligase [Candidatus Omnitrophota bacterium]
MALRLYNTLSRTAQEFQPMDGRTVRMYVCGPTVYDDPHIGHARSAYIFDILRRYLTHKGYQVTFVRNVTDVDDKIIEKARQEFVHRPPSTVHSDLKTVCAEVAERYLKSYHETMDRLGIGRPEIEPKATEHVVPEMTDLIAKLLMQGVAYEAGGDVYFAVRKCPGYGKLSHRALDELQAGARVEPGESKQDPLDFALWKKAKPGEPSWNSPWGEGRPGWHIECSAMSTKYLGDAFDIHGGGIDLVFPHHENEIAQAESAGKPFARFWIHNGLLTVNGEKMSKSLGNFVTVEQALQQGNGNPNVLKVFFLSAHYRSPLDYTESNIKAASSRFKGWFHLMLAADIRKGRAAVPAEIPEEIKMLRTTFDGAMNNDLNTPQALAILDQLLNYGYQCFVDAENIKGKDSPEKSMLLGKLVAARNVLLQCGNALGLFDGFESISIPDDVQELIKKREEARRLKNFNEADRLRKLVEDKGFIIEDMPDGPFPIPNPKRFSR